VLVEGVRLEPPPAKAATGRRTPKELGRKSEMNKAVFIDRDGTISEEVGYVNHPMRFRLLPHSAEAIRTLNQAGWLAVLVTNQAGVARGYFSETMILEVHARLVNELEREGARLDGIYYCPHHPTVGETPYRFDCDCRKPKPGLIHRAASELAINLAESWMVGDRFGDVQLAGNAGLHSAFVLTGYGRGEWEHQRGSWTVEPEIVAENLLEAVQEISQNRRR
jgi:D-glycero-D-manno-heptose 1,7-bisphosphate phosphatase